MIFYEASVSQICFLFRLNDRQWSFMKPRSPKYVSYLDSMIVNDLLQSISRLNLSYFDFRIVNDLLKVSVAHIRFLFIFYDRQWSLTMLRSPKYVSYLNSRIVNDLLQCLRRLNLCLIWTQGSWMISYNASDALICVLFELNDHQWSSKKSRSLIYVFYLFSMIVNDLLQCLGRPNMCLI